MKACRDKEGQGECRECKRQGKYSWTWMVFLYQVDGYPGYYCHKCAERLEALKEEVGRYDTSS